MFIHPPYLSIGMFCIPRIIPASGDAYTHNLRIRKIHRDGRIFVKSSEQGKGTTFCVELKK